MTPKQFRDFFDFSQADLAKMLGVHIRTVSAWETDRQAIPPFLHLALAELKRRIESDNE